MIYRYQIETIITQDYRDETYESLGEEDAHLAGQIFTSKHTDIVFAPSPIQALKKLAFPKIYSCDTIQITIHLVSNPLGLQHSIKTKSKKTKI